LEQAGITDSPLPLTNEERQGGSLISYGHVPAFIMPRTSKPISSEKHGLLAEAMRPELSGSTTTGISMRSVLFLRRRPG
jgi:hypothetical protein